MPDTLTRLPQATTDQRHRWADLLWKSIALIEKGTQTDYWTLEQLRLIAREIEPPLKPNGDVDGR